LSLPLFVWIVSGAPLALDMPVFERFNFRGGVTVRPEFLALFLGLSTYTAAFIGEIVRAGILAVSRGQKEAAAALGFTRGQALRLVILPQALRVIVPPLTSQYLNLTKNSSLAIAIGYPDLVSVFAGTALNQSGRAIEIVAITMGIYLALSLLTAFVMNVYNARVALKGG
jgi:general L-amino acid transport system permease protein